MVQGYDAQDKCSAREMIPEIPLSEEFPSLNPMKQA
jgi:hypothetical protein